jgi:hypothetical protein
VLGCDLLYRTRGFFDPTGGDWMTRHFGADPRDRLETAMLRCGPGANLELLAWNRADPPPSPGPHPGIGAAHVAIYVDDVRAAADFLAAQPGTRVLGSPTVVIGEPNEGTEFVYVLLPWGMCLELVRWPRLMPYGLHAAARLHAPAAAWRQVGAAGEGPPEA